MQLSWDVLADVGVLCDRGVRLGVMIKQRPCTHCEKRLGRVQIQKALETRGFVPCHSYTSIVQYTNKHK